MFDIVLVYQFPGFWCQLGSNLPSNLDPKIHQNSAQEASKFQANFHDVWAAVSILEASWVDFWKVLGCKLNAKLTELEGKAEKVVFFVFAEEKIKKSRFRDLENHEKSMQHGLKNRYKTEHPWLVKVCWISDPTWLDFGKILAAKMEPCWHQRPPKPDPTTNPNKYYFLEGLRIDFGWI